MAGEHWTREQLIVALNVYTRLRFGQFHKKNPVVVDVAARIDRSADALAMKLGQFASLDPHHRARKVGGLPNTSKLDRELWAEFQAHREELLIEGERRLAELFNASDDDVVEVLPRQGVRCVLRDAGETERKAWSVRRVGQSTFRDAVLNNFDGRCAVTGLRVRSLLVASHIRPWSDFPNERLDVTNSVALNRLHDAAFDRFLIGFDDARRLVLSPALQATDDPLVKSEFQDRSGAPMLVDDQTVLPDTTFLAWHCERVRATQTLP